MNRDEFLLLLARAVRDRAITEGEAARLLRMFDAKEVEPSDDDLPLPLGATVKLPTEGEVVAALSLLSTLGSLARLHRNRVGVRELLQDRLQAQGQTLAKRLTDGGTLRAWHESFDQAVRRNVIQQRAVGAGRVIVPSEVSDTIVEQSAYLSRFAEEAALRRLAGEPLSYFQMAARSALYAGAGRAESFRAEAEGRDPDTFVRYEAQDDASTCSPCLDAEGVYSVGEPFPVPGAVCLGSGNCRCQLEFLEDAA